jgi:predicted nucleic acid-binding protein
VPPPERLVCNTGPVRYFALVGRFDLLVAVSGGMVTVPRQGLDPDEDPDGVAGLLSEIGESERYWSARSTTSDAMDNWSRLRALRRSSEIEVVDLTEEELVAYTEITSFDFADELDLHAPLGRGESAVIAIAESRGWAAALDDAGARRGVQYRSPATTVSTSRELLRRAVVDDGLLDSAEATIVYDDMRAKGYRGPPSLW